jgi:predicted nuclease of predicted toxin-antitoxin system
MSLRFVTDENFDNNIIRHLKQLRPDFDAVRVQDVGLRQTPDPTILEWAANNNCILLTHDIATMPDFAYARIRESLPMPGIFVFPEKASTEDLVESLILTLEASVASDWENHVTYLPF